MKHRPTSWNRACGMHTNTTSWPRCTPIRKARCTLHKHTAVQQRTHPAAQRQPHPAPQQRPHPAARLRLHPAARQQLHQKNACWTFGWSILKWRTSCSHHPSNACCVAERRKYLLVASVSQAREPLVIILLAPLFFLWSSAVGIPQPSGQVGSALDGAVVFKL